MFDVKETLSSLTCPISSETDDVIGAFIMNLMSMMTRFVANEESGFTVRGRHGVVAAWPERSSAEDGGEPTYRVDALYYESDPSLHKHLRQSGFRLSTVCCICACVCVGESGLDRHLIEQMNALFLPA